MSQQDAPCLLYPDNLGIKPSVTQEESIAMLSRATQLAQTRPFQWGWIDKPSEGALYLSFIPPQQPMLQDGIRYQEPEQRYVLPAGAGRELEVIEAKFGYIPGQDQMASRVRRRYRLCRGGHPQLMLIHYTRGQNMPIVGSLNHPVRAYPLRSINEPAIFVMGEKVGQKIYPAGAERPMPAMPSMPPMAAIQGASMGGNAQAMLAAQNSNMDALERRSRETSGARQAQQRPDDEDSADESDTISARSLAYTRYKRNHEFMNEVFMHAAFKTFKDEKPKPPPFSTFDKSELEAKVDKLNKEVEELQAKAAARKEARTRAEEREADVAMSVDPIGEAVA